ncbi:hypothetical protein [Rhodococcus sp. NPDC004095]
MADPGSALPLFAADPVAAVVLALAFLVFLFSEYRIGRTHPDSGPTRDAWSGVAVGLALATAYLGGAVSSVLLVEGLGEPYRRYMDRTKRLIPFVL